MDYASILSQTDVTYPCGEHLAALEAPLAVAGSLKRELRLPTLLADLPGEVLRDILPAVDRVIADADEDSDEFFPVLTALTLAVYTLLYGPPSREWREVSLREGERLLAALVLLEGLRRLGAYSFVRLCADPWAEGAAVALGEPDAAIIGRFMDELGYLRR